MLILSFSFFVIPDEDYANRLAINLTLFLIAVAFKYSVSDGLPKIAYATAFDQYMLYTYAFLMLDPVLWTAIFLIARGKRISSLADPAETAATLETLGEWNLYLFYLKAGFLVLGHFVLYRSARAHIAASSKTISEIGNLDDALILLLKNNGVKLRPDGTVANMDAYNKLIQG
jgi:hypothetical protein